MSTQLLIPEVQEALISNLRNLIQETETHISGLKAELQARKKSLNEQGQSVSSIQRALLPPSQIL